MTAGSMIDYEALAQDAMRGIVRTVLTRAAKSGLPGDHHFYISFDTGAPGVALSKRLREKYPSEMTIVLQHRFWDLLVSDERFEVKLTFDGIPERLVVPFAAIKVFFDPSVRYGLQFEGPDSGGDADQMGPAGLPGLGDAALDDDAPRPITTRSASPRKPRATKKSRAEKEGADNTTAPSPITANVKPTAVQPAAKAPAVAPAAKPSEPKTGEGKEPAKPAEVKPLAPVAPAGGAQIVSLDQFRKK